jgi:hypothetical protein
MQQTVEKSNGAVKEVLSLFTIALNEGDKDPLDIAEQAGREVFL